MPKVVRRIKGHTKSDGTRVKGHLRTVKVKSHRSVRAHPAYHMHSLPMHSMHKSKAHKSKAHKSYLNKAKGWGRSAGTWIKHNPYKTTALGVTGLGVLGVGANHHYNPTRAIYHGY